MTLKELIKDCGGAKVVAERLGCTPQNISKMIKKGHLPYSELEQRIRAEVLAEMQQSGALTADEIRGIGLYPVKNRVSAR